MSADFRIGVKVRFYVTDKLKPSFELKSISVGDQCINETTNEFILCANGEGTCIRLESGYRC